MKPYLRAGRLLLLAGLLSIGFSSTAMADLQSDSNLIFDWAESQYTQLLTPPTNTRTTTFQNHHWFYRYYTQSHLYLAINENSQVYLYEGDTGKLQYLNEAAVYLEQINTSQTSQPEDGNAETENGSSQSGNDNETENSNGQSSNTNTDNETGQSGNNEPTSGSICEGYLNAFNHVTALVDVSCQDEQLNIYSANGLPALKNNSGADQVMVGINAWINRVPIPYEYNWQIPTAPNWQTSPIEATAKGPIAVAVNGVPIFHYERRPDVSTSLANYTSENDTVVQGELDHCGGHSGQGDDYHYHYTPVCLLENHDLTQPIAFGLDGAPVYYGEGGTDYYGHGQYNDWNNFPTNIDLSALDECNAYQQSDGSYVHYTTKQPPYVIGCHHAFFDTALQIEPRPMEGREQGLPTPLGGEYGEPISTQVSAFQLNDDGSYQMEFAHFSIAGQTSSVIYRRSNSDENCWEFEFRENKEQSGEIQIACRNNSSPPPNQNSTAKPRFLPVHSHTH